MIMAANQPYFVPYIGYWQLIHSVDTFAIADNYNYIKGGWINRNRILENNNIRYYNIEVEHVSQNRFISDHYLKPINKQVKLDQLRGFYSKAPYKKEGLQLMESILTFDGSNLADFLYRSIRIICDYLGIKTNIIRTSDFEQDFSLKFADRIYDYCRQMGADEYHNLIGGMELYSFEEFKEHGIKLAFVESVPYEYPQNSEEFIFGLSIIDVIMNNSVQDIQKMMESYRLIVE
jgi:hypothetical protein